MCPQCLGRVVWKSKDDDQRGFIHDGLGTEAANWIGHETPNVLAQGPPEREARREPSGVADGWSLGAAG